MKTCKVIFVVLDGLRYDAARSSMGYLNHLVEARRAVLYKVVAELPTLSRPLYEVLLTGTPCLVHGIGANTVVRLSEQKSLFHLARDHGLTTAAAAYYWISELYQKTPFNPWEDREQHDERRPIQHGVFYFDDAYPDSHLFADAERLRRSYHPDFLYVHAMGIDHAGHRFGGMSKAYRARVIGADSLLSMLVPQWLRAGYHVIVTADHGMGADGQHGGTSPEEREVPLFGIGERFRPGVVEEPLPQLAVAPLVCQLLGLPTGENMIPCPLSLLSV